MTRKSRKSEWGNAQLTLAMEWGFRAREKGKNLELATSDFIDMLEGRKTPEEAAKAPQIITGEQNAANNR